MGHVNHTEAGRETRKAAPFDQRCSPRAPYGVSEQTAWLPCATLKTRPQVPCGVARPFSFLRVADRKHWKNVTCFSYFLIGTPSNEADVTHITRTGRLRGSPRSIPSYEFGKVFDQSP